MCYFQVLTVVQQDRQCLWSWDEGSIPSPAQWVKSLVQWVKDPGAGHSCSTGRPAQWVRVRGMGRSCSTGRPAQWIKDQGVGCICGLDLIPGVGTPYASGWPKKKKSLCCLKQQSCGNLLCENSELTWPGCLGTDRNSLLSSLLP